MKKIVLTLALGSLPLLAQPANSQKDPFIKGEKNQNKGGVPSSDPMNISLCYEVFSLPLQEAAKLRREDLTDTGLYAKLVGKLESGAVKQEVFSVVRGRPGQKVSSGSISELIYPTEWIPPQSPRNVGVAIIPEVEKDDLVPAPDVSKLKSTPDAKSIPVFSIPATASTFDTKNTGLTLEFEANIGVDLRWLDLLVSSIHVNDIGPNHWGQGLAIVEMPEFEVQRINTGATLRLNQPFMIGTINRPASSKIDPDSANQVWFAFVTASIAKY